MAAAERNQIAPPNAATKSWTLENSGTMNQAQRGTQRHARKLSAQHHEHFFGNKHATCFILIIRSSCRSLICDLM